MLLFGILLFTLAVPVCEVSWITIFPTDHSYLHQALWTFAILYFRLEIEFVIEKQGKKKIKTLRQIELTVAKHKYQVCSFCYLASQLSFCFFHSPLFLLLRFLTSTQVCEHPRWRKFLQSVAFCCLKWKVVKCAINNTGSINIYYLRLSKAEIIVENVLSLQGSIYLWKTASKEG